MNNIYYWNFAVICLSLPFLLLLRGVLLISRGVVKYFCYNIWLERLENITLLFVYSRVFSYYMNTFPSFTLILNTSKVQIYQVLVLFKYFVAIQNRKQYHSPSLKVVQCVEFKLDFTFCIDRLHFLKSWQRITSCHLNGVTLIMYKLSFHF